MTLFFPIRRPPPGEPDPIDEIKDWVPGWHPLLDLFRCLAMISRAQVDLARGHEALWAAYRRTLRLWMLMAVLWLISGLLSAAPTILSLFRGA